MFLWTLQYWDNYEISEEENHKTYLMAKVKNKKAYDYKNFQSLIFLFEGNIFLKWIDFLMTTIKENHVNKLKIQLMARLEICTFSSTFQWMTKYRYSYGKQRVILVQ